MKVGILFLVLGILSVLTANLVYAQVNTTPQEFGIRLLPEKIVENSEATIQVFLKQGKTIVPKKIEGITAISMDSSIVSVLNVKESESGFISEISIKAGKSGSANIFLAAPGFSSKEFPIRVYGSKLNQEQFLVKTIPSTFTSGGLTHGLISVELADEDGFPVIATKNTIITLSTSNKNVVELVDKTLIIKKGKYFAIGEFNVKGAGETTIYISSPGMETATHEINVDEKEKLTVALYTIPQIINSHWASNGHIIIQLQEDGGKPVIAEKDIPVNFKILKSDFLESVNTSYNVDEIKTVGYMQIDKGTYWAHTTFTTLTGLEDSYEITVSVKDPLTLETVSVDTVDLEVLDEKIVRLETVPILATGKRELVGIAYLEDDAGNPIKAKNRVQVNVESSDERFLSVDNIVIKQGDSSAQVFGYVASSVTDDLELLLQKDDSELINVEIFGPDDASLMVAIEPFVSKILTGTNFPIALYMEDGGDVIPFPKNYDVFVSPSEFVKVKTKSIKQGDSIVLLDAESLKQGKSTLSFDLEDISETLSVNILSSEPSMVDLTHSEKIFAGTNDIFSIQLLNSQFAPIFASKDTQIKFVLEDKSLIEMPETITMEKGKYFKNFDVAPKKGGTAKLSILVEGLPLTTYDIEISSLSPDITISAPDTIGADESFLATVSVTNQDSPLRDMKVAWNVNGGIVSLYDSKTGTTGNAVVSVFPEGAGKITVEATITGSWFSPTTVSKTIQVKPITEFMTFGDENQDQQSQVEQYNKIEIFGFDPVLILVPTMIGLIGLMLKRKGAMNINKQTI